MILLSRGESIYYDGRLVVSTERPGKISAGSRSRSAGITASLRVYTTRLSEVWQVSRRTPFAFYHFILYVGVLSLGLHLAKMVSATVLLISLFSGFDQLLVSHLLPESALTNPVASSPPSAAISRWAWSRCSRSFPKAERAYAAPIVPLYLFYALVHILPMTVGFLNWITLRVWGRRVYRDHYESERSCAPPAPRPAQRRGKLHDREGTPAPALYMPVTTGRTAPGSSRRKAKALPRSAPMACPSSTTG